MAGKKKTGGSGKKVGRRETGSIREKKREEKVQARVEARQEEDRPKATERIQEKGSGFGMIKIVAGVVVALIIGSTIAARLGGSEDADRGDKEQGERCETTKECAKGFICYAHKDEPRMCLKSCASDGDDACDPGYTCTTGTQGGRKKARIRSVCVEDGAI